MRPALALVSLGLLVSLGIVLAQPTGSGTTPGTVVNKVDASPELGGTSCAGVPDKIVVAEGDGDMFYCDPSTLQWIKIGCGCNQAPPVASPLAVDCASFSYTGGACDGTDITNVGTLSFSATSCFHVSTVPLESINRVKVEIDPACLEDFVIAGTPDYLMKYENDGTGHEASIMVQSGTAPNQKVTLQGDLDASEDAFRLTIDSATASAPFSIRVNESAGDVEIMTLANNSETYIFGWDDAGRYGQANVSNLSEVMDLQFTGGCDGDGQPCDLSNQCCSGLCSGPGGTCQVNAGGPCPSGASDHPQFTMKWPSRWYGCTGSSDPYTGRVLYTQSYTGTGNVFQTEWVTPSTIVSGGLDSNLTTIANLSCSTGQPLEWGASDWTCGTDDTGVGAQNIWTTISDNDGTAVDDPTPDGTGDTLTFIGTGIISVSGDATADSITISATENDASTTNELQTLDSTGDATSHTLTLSNSGGSLKFLEGTGIALSSTTGLNGTLTIASTVVDTDTDDQPLFETIATTSGTPPVAEIPADTLTISAGTGITVTGNETTDTVTIASTVVDTDDQTCAEVSGCVTGADPSTTNELQTLDNTSDSTSHTVTLSSSGGSMKLIEGTGITLTTGGTGLNGTVTVASTVVDTDTGDDITVNSSAANDPNFLNGDIDWTLDGSNNITATVGCTDCVTLGTETTGSLPLSELTDDANTGRFLTSGGAGDPTWLAGYLDADGTDDDVPDAGEVSGGTAGQITDASITAADLATDSVSADELSATGVEAELEGVLDIPDLQGLLPLAKLTDDANTGRFLTSGGGAGDPTWVAGYLDSDGTDSVGSGDDVTVDGTAQVNPDFDSVTPAAPTAADVGGINVIWQSASNNVSAYIKEAALKLRNPTDTAWTDGVFTSWTSASTLLLDALDDVNEALSDLAPDQPQSLASATLTCASGCTFYAGKASAGTGLYYKSASGEDTTTYSCGNGAGCVIVSSTLSVDTPSVGNADLSADGSDSFSDGDAGTLTAYLTSAGSENADGTLNLVGATPPDVDGGLTFNSVTTYNGFTKWKRGDATYDPTTLGSGYNKLKLRHTVNAINRDSNGFEVFYDNAGTDPTFGSACDLAETTVNELYLSGVKFYSASSVLYVAATINNLFDNSYLTTAFTYVPAGGSSWFTSGSCAVDGTVDTAWNSTVSTPPNITDTATLSGGATKETLSLVASRLTNVARITCTALQPGASVASSTTDNALLNTYSQTTAVAPYETFVDEYRRLPSTWASFDSTTATVTSQYTSSTSLNTLTAEAQVYYATTDRGGLIYPSDTNFSSGFFPTGSPDYSADGTYSATRSYYRSFIHTGGGKSNSVIRFYGTLTAADFVADGTVDNKIEVLFKLPDDGTTKGTAWADAVKAYTVGDDLQDDGDGASDEPVRTTGTSGTCGGVSTFVDLPVTFGGKSTGDTNKRIYMRVNFQTDDADRPSQVIRCIEMRDKAGSGVTGSVWSQVEEE